MPRTKATTKKTTKKKAAKTTKKATRKAKVVKVVKAAKKETDSPKKRKRPNIRSMDQEDDEILAYGEVEDYSPPIMIPTLEERDEQHGVDYRIWAAVDGFLPMAFEDPVVSMGARMGPSEEQRKALRQKPQNFWERSELVLLCFRALQMRLRKAQIRQLLADFIAFMGYDPYFEEMRFQTVLTKARLMLREEIEIDSQDHVANGYESMVQVLQDPNATPADKIKAQQVINELVGVGARFNPKIESAEDKVNLIRHLLANDMV